jgi:DNA polymerase I
MFLLPDDEDHVLVSIDLDQIDIRCVAAHSQDHNLLDIMNDPSRDIHQEVADLARVTRPKAKTLDLGWLYGRTVNGLAKTEGMDLETARQVDASMRAQFVRVMQWQNEVRQLGENGILLDNGFGRHLRVDPDRAFTQAPAMIGQGTTRDLIAEGLIDLAHKAPDVVAMLRVIVHDEVVASVPRRHATEIATLIQSCMSRDWAPAGKSRPVRVTAGQGKPFTFGENWAQLYV